MNAMPEERLQKVLAHAGIGSRRACEDLIEQGRVAVNGHTVTELGTKVDPEEADILCDGEPIRRETRVYYLVNKPPGVVCTSSPREKRPRAIDLVRHDSRRLYTVGRLDAASRGLIILTNDGQLTQRLTHPRHKVPKTYRVRVRGSLSRDDVQTVQDGVHLAEGKASFSRVRVLKRKRRYTDLQVQLTQGVNRQIRRVLAKVGNKVMDLQRTAIGPLRDPGLRQGAHRRLRPDEVRQLKQCARSPSKRSRRK